MHPKRADIGALIDRLLDDEIEFIVVGGAAAVIHGSPTTTYDLDIVPRRSEANIARLHTLLGELEAYVREPGDRRLRPTRSQVATSRQLLLLTSLGPLDLLNELHDGRGYEDLANHILCVSRAGRSLQVLDLSTLIEVKAAAGRPKDRIIVPILIDLLRRESGREEPEG